MPKRHHFYKKKRIDLSINPFYKKVHRVIKHGTERSGRNSRINGGESAPAYQSPPMTAAEGPGLLRRGALHGAAAVVGWACFGVGSTASLAQGFRPEDLTMLR